jgi:hypothetical protein
MEPPGVAVLSWTLQEPWPQRVSHLRAELSTEAASGAGSRRLLLATAGVVVVIRVAVLQPCTLLALALAQRTSRV